MPRFRVTVRRTEISQEIVTLDADSALHAAQKAQRYVDGERRGVSVVQPFDDDSRATHDREVVAIREA